MLLVLLVDVAAGEEVELVGQLGKCLPPAEVDVFIIEVVYEVQAQSDALPEVSCVQTGLLGRLWREHPDDLAYALREQALELRVPVRD